MKISKAPVFEWDENKNEDNRRKHKVSFEDAQTCFFDERAILLPDPDHSAKEERFVLLGTAFSLRILIVAHCYRKGSVIRIISARKANSRERQEYLQSFR